MSDTEHQELWIMVASPFHSITACYASTPQNMLCSSSNCTQERRLDKNLFISDVSKARVNGLDISVYLTF